MKQKHNFDYAPTFLGKVGSPLEYYHSEFIRWKQNYIEELEALREMETVKHEPTLVKSWRLLVDETHPRTKADFFSRIDSYIKHNQSNMWVYSHIEESVVEEYESSWDDYTTEYTVYDLYAVIKDKETVVNGDAYKAQIAQVQMCLDELEKAKSLFIEHMKTIK